jgi:SAM-dependent methyltransferase
MQQNSAGIVRAVAVRLADTVARCFELPMALPRPAFAVFALAVLALLPLLGVGAELSHDATARHSFEDVDHWSAVFDDPARDSWQKPAELVAALELAKGAWVVDLGAGTGYLTRYLARAVGPEGAVLAVDTEPALVQHLRSRAEREGTPNVTPILASADDPRLPKGSADVVLILDTFHHVDDRVEYARRLKRALRPGGRVAIVDWREGELPVGPDPDHKLPRAHVVAEMTEAGYELVAEPNLLPYQFVLIFRPAE